MLFNSFTFILAFLPVTLIFYYFFSKLRLNLYAKYWLLACSLFFYSWWNLLYLPLLLFSITTNFLISRVISKSKENQIYFFRGKTYLVIGLLFNLSLLFGFKYFDFFIDNINLISGSDINLLNLILPLAISFFTLQQIAFLMDVYEGLAEEKKYLDYALFVSFFPQLIAGPIVHHNELMPQFRKNNFLANYQNIFSGIFIFSIGLIKKVLIADSFAIWANQGFIFVSNPDFISSWITSLSFTFQIYYDFSGYTDMAIGLALLFNIKLPRNFNSPYKATGMIDFWSRWHITLTRFITSYIYSPILRNFTNVNFQNAMLTTLFAFLVAGLWHGASWLFLIFGALHGIGIVINHIWRKKIKIKLNIVISWLITFVYVNITFVFFRARNFDDAINLTKGMFGFNGLGGGIIDYQAIIFIVVFAFAIFLKNSNQIIVRNTNLKYFLAVLFISVSLLHLFTQQLESQNNFEFLYFNF